MALNLKTKTVVETAPVHLEDAVGEKLYDENGNPVIINIYGKSSKQYKQALADLNRKNINRKGKQQSFATNVEDNVDILVAITKSAENVDMGNGPIDTPAAFKELYSDSGLFFVKDQIQAALEDNENFIQK